VGLGVGSGDAISGADVAAAAGSGVDLGPALTATSPLAEIASIAAAGEASAGAAILAAAEPAVFFAALAAAADFQASPCSSVRRRATGASTVEEADLTNSPMSLSASSTFLLGTPNSLASSWTLALATVLLLGRPNPGRARTLVDGCSHRLKLIEMS
jgi:hypothetical protein